MQIDWTPLRAELAACRRDGLAVPFWWRDDDAIAPTPELEQLEALVQETQLPVHLAIVPAQTTVELANYVDGKHLIPVIHGWAHEDHSGPEEKKNEFLTDRPDLVQDSARALDRMRNLFGPVLRYMFVPPWNRVQTPLLSKLSDQGYEVLSTYGPRDHIHAVPGLIQINTHIDPIWWKGTRDLVTPETLLNAAVGHLSARRRGTEDSREPFGLLTHHLVHTPAIWAFAERFVNEMLSGGATPWTMERR